VCGINLFLDKTGFRDETIIRKMNAAISHRGPDASRFGKYSVDSGNLFIGNDRLKIIDTSNDANQPFISSDGRYCLSFNGEIYNYKELKQKLNLKYPFSTGSDSEVLLYHLIENGAQGIKELNGMFAFILYDKKSNTLLAARDRHGIKPFYYYSDKKNLLISSEIKGLLASELINKELNSDQIPHYLKYKYAKRPETFYKNIFELEPGHFIESDIRKDSFEIKNWQDQSFDINNAEKPFLVKDIKDLLYKAVERQLQSDVANGIFLSGGIDSTLLLAITKELGVKNFPSFSIINSPEDRNFGTDDYLFAGKAAKLYNSEHHAISINSDTLKYSENIFQQLDQPIGDSALLLTWLISEHASSKIRVAISGAGADEWFGGYNRHEAYKKYLNLFYGNNLLIKLSGSVSDIIPEGFDFPLRRQARLWNKFTKDISSDPFETYNNFRSINIFDPLTLSRNIISKQSLSKEELLAAAFSSDRKEYLVSDILMLTDKMSMQKSLEVRVPYLDNDLTDYISKLSSSLLLQKGRKWILKEILDDLGGNEFTSRSKEGFGMPIGKWIKEEKNIFLLEHIKNKNSCVYNFIDFKKTNEIVSMHLSGKKDHSAALWSLIVLTNWLQNEF
jgi:asparagine synthase (glutamine-hydrolysing)